MSQNLWLTGSVNAINTTLNGSVATGDTSITLTSATGLQSPGVIVVDRISGTGTSTPTLREYISYTGISTNTLTGCTRGLASSTAQAHASGAQVEECFSITHWNDMISALKNVLTSAGALDTTKVVDLTTIQTLTNKTLTSPTNNTPTENQPTVSGTIQTLTTDTDGATVTFNLNTGVHSVTLAGNRTLALSNDATGKVFVVRLIQDGTGSRTVTWWSTIHWVGGGAPTLTTTASHWDTFGFITTGSSTYDGYLIGANLS